MKTNNNKTIRPQNKSRPAGGASAANENRSPANRRGKGGG